MSATINSRIETALATLTCPVNFIQMDDYAYIKTFPSVTYFCYLDQAEEHADNAETAHGYYIQLDVWNKANYMALVENIRSLMHAAGFGYISGQDLVEAANQPDGPIYRKMLRFNYIEDLTT